uniref:Peptidase S1 domain-containing protein n=1 Tax=Rhodosorus marinus TaxID=101924 RepID=A0A7S2ZS30_9RHOD|mmetsp:Transcript_29464/g.113993  ORF Transcript_29464/g.113993 Transcript_29464/m.113993 type:complete len:688 (+) Transcript_29464:107-2170(+)
MMKTRLCMVGALVVLLLLGGLNGLPLKENVEFIETAVNGAKTRRLHFGEATEEFSDPTEWLFQKERKVSFLGSTRIFNGERAGDGDFPYIAALVLSARNNISPQPFCTGALIDKDIVLTAAHCVADLENSPLQFSACIGDPNLNTGRTRCSRVTDAIISDSYIPELLVDGFDLAVLKLAATIDVDPIAISFERPPNGQLTTAVGYGRASRSAQTTDGILRFAQTRYVNNANCRALRQSFGAVRDADLLCSDGNFAGDGSTVCNGDSGGPLIVRGATRSQDYTIGVASFITTVSDDCDDSFENVYMSTSSSGHVALLRDAVSQFGGSIIDAANNDTTQRDECRVSEQECMALGDLMCVESDLTEDCCESAGAVLECLVPIAEECGDLLITQNAEEIQDALAQSSICGGSDGSAEVPDVKECMSSELRKCEENFDDACFNSPTFRCCTDASEVVDCKRPFIEDCELSQTVRSFDEFEEIFEAVCSEVLEEGSDSEQPDSGDPEESGSCFPGDARVVLESGLEKKMSDLLEGDRVLAANGKYSDIIGFTHKMAQVQSEFVNVVAGKESLRLTPEHYVPVGVNGLVLVAAKSLAVGDIVTLGNQTTVRVSSIDRTRASGLYNPETLDGTIVVDGVLASTYTQHVNPHIARLLLAVPRIVYRLGFKHPLGSLFHSTMPEFIFRYMPKGSPTM